jgi:hypothetical protein
VAKDSHGHAKVLIVQGWLPPQSAEVVSPLGGHGWIDLDPAKPVQIPMYGTFQWSNLRRFRD